MTEVYLLLRNNEQSGPYSLDDLAELQLTEKDLVKQAGKQSGWFHPYELGLPYMLSWHVQKQNANGATHVSHSSPIKADVPAATGIATDPAVDAVDQTIEELSKKITAIRNNLKMVEEQIHAEAEEQAKQPVTLKPENVKSKKRFSYAWILFIVIFIVIMLLSWMLYSQFSKTKSVSSTSASLNETAVGTSAFEYPQTNLFFNDPPSADGVYQENAIDSASLSATVPAVLKPKAPQRRTGNTRNTGNRLITPVSSSANDSGFHPEKITDEGRVALSFVMAEEERKTLLQKIAALFKKKDEPVNTNQNPVTEETVYDKFKIGIHTTNYPWLKGVQGLTLTLKNLSSQTIRYATVNVVYYTAQDAVIERSTVHFKNILPGKVQAVAAPDHQWAHHAGYEIVSAAVVKP